MEDHEYQGCLRGGNMCDECFRIGMVQDSAMFESWVDKLARALASLTPVASLGEQGVQDAARGGGNEPPKVDARWIFELTLTVPKDKTVVDILDGFHKIVKSQMFAIKYWKYCIELHDDGSPHLHAVLFSTARYFDVSKVKKLYPYRFECKKVRDLPSYWKYIHKESLNEKIKAFCLANNIDQFKECPQQKS